MIHDTRHINITVGAESQYVLNGTKITQTVKASKGFWLTLASVLLGRIPLIVSTTISDTNPSKPMESHDSSDGQLPPSKEQTNDPQLIPQHECVVQILSAESRISLLREQPYLQCLIVILNGTALGRTLWVSIPPFLLYKLNVNADELQGAQFTARILIEDFKRRSAYTSEVRAFKVNRVILLNRFNHDAFKSNMLHNINSIDDRLDRIEQRLNNQKGARKKSRKVQTGVKHAKSNESRSRHARRSRT